MPLTFTSILFLSDDFKRINREFNVRNAKNENDLKIMMEICNKKKNDDAGIDAGLDNNPLNFADHFKLVLLAWKDWREDADLYDAHKIKPLADQDGQWPPHSQAHLVRLQRNLEVAPDYPN